MLNDNLDKYIKENLENARLDWDKDSMWEDIENQLPAKTKDQRGWLFLSVLSVLIIATAVIYTTLIYDRLTAEQITRTNTSPYPISLSNKLIEKQQPSNSAKNHNEKDFSDDKEAKSIDEQKVSSDLREKREKMSTTSSYEIALDISTDNKSNRLIVDNKRNENNASTIELVDSEVASVSEMNVTDENPIVDNRLTKNEVSTQKELVSLIRMLEPLISQNNYIVGQSSIYSRLIPAKTSNKKTLGIHPSRIMQSLQLGIYSGIGIANRHLSSQSGEPIINLREQHESTLEVLQGGLMMRKNVTSKLFVQSGIEYQRINEKLDYTETSNTIVPISTDSAFVSTSNTGALQFYSGNVDATITRSQRSIRYNAYHSINVPLHIGYNRRMSRGLSIAAYTGPVINVYQSFSGYNIGSDNRLVPSDIIQKGSLLNAIDAGLSLEYALGNKIDLSLGAVYRRSLSSFSIDGIVSQSYNNMNFQVGILYNFF